MVNGKKVIYFNHWFSSIECLISDLKDRYKGENAVSIEIVGSSSNEFATYRKVVDRFLESSETVSEWIDTCKNNNVDMFFCRDKLSLMQNKDVRKETLNKFKELCVDVVLDTNWILEDKVEFYNLISDICVFNKYPYITMPKYWHFYSCTDRASVNRELNVALASLMQDGKTPVMKLVSGEGGLSYREIKCRHDDKYKNLEYPNSRAISLDATIRMFEEMSVDEARTIMLMEKLVGPEISLDCYNSRTLGFIAYGREKSGRTQKIVDCQHTDNVEYIEMTNFAKEIAKSFNLKNPFNIQFMRNEETGMLAVLEINSRMSGGCYMLTPLGVNLCDIVIKDRLFNNLTAKDTEFNTGKAVATVTRAEKPILL